MSHEARLAESIIYADLQNEAKAALYDQAVAMQRAEAEEGSSVRDGRDGRTGRDGRSGPDWQWVVGILLVVVGTFGGWQVMGMRNDVQESLKLSRQNSEALVAIQTELKLRVETARSEHEQFRDAMERVVGRLEVLERRR